MGIRLFYHQVGEKMNDIHLVSETVSHMNNKMGIVDC